MTMTTLYSRVTTSITKDSPTHVLSGGLDNLDMIVTPDTFTDTINSLPNSPMWIMDVETNGFNPYDMHQICGIGLADLDSEHAYYFPFRHQSDEPNLSQDQLKQLVEFINNTCKTVVGYNVKFDAKFLHNEGINIDAMNLLDVLVMVRMTEPTTMNRLSLTDTLIRTYGEKAGAYDLETKKVLKKNKWFRDFSLAPPSILGPYCIEDVKWTRKLYKDRLRKVMTSHQLELFHFQTKLTKTLYMMERRCVIIDISMLNRLTIKH